MTYLVYLPNKLGIYLKLFDMDFQELHNNTSCINIHHSELTSKQNIKRTIFVITEEESPIRFRSYVVEVPKFIRDGILLSPTIKTFYWYCLN